jgi:hypothetical protein
MKNKAKSPVFGRKSEALSSKSETHGFWKKMENKANFGASSFMTSKYGFSED